MEDEEIDIISEIDTKSGLNDVEDYDLPSKNVHLHPEFTQHPWLLDQAWSLEHCADEQSRAAIEKMLHEEQLYLDGKTLRPAPTRAPVTKPSVTQSAMDAKKPSGPNRQAHKRLPWTDDEKAVFFRGLEIYGRRWTKIKELLPTRTHQQVKHFGLAHFKHKKDQDSLTNQERPSAPESVADTLTLLSTARPTIPVTKPGRKGRNRKNDRPNEAPNESDLPKSITSLRKISKLDLAEIVRIKHADPSDSEDDEIDIEASSDEFDAAESEPLCAQQTEEKPSKNMEPMSIHEVQEDNREDNCTVDQKKENEVEQETDRSESEHINKPVDRKHIIALDSSDDTSSSEKEHQNRAKRVNIDPSGILTSQDNVDNKDNNTLACDGVQYASKDAQFDAWSPSGMSDHTEDVISDACVPSKPDVQETDHFNEFGVATASGKIVFLRNPSSETKLPADVISQEEMTIHSDFFDDRSGVKNGDRYLRIRNYIIDAWEKCKPEYTTKTSIRSGMKKCGDVNCIGRIHAYLEQKGAINFGCAQVQYSVPWKGVKSKATKGHSSGEEVICKRDLVGLRKRRVKDGQGQWVDENELQGKTVEHKTVVSPVKPTRSKVPRCNKSTYDPFQLIPCLEFAESCKAPFSVTVEASALVIMDMHAHLSKTEVIGLLGGQYDRGRDTLAVTMAVPCDSLSTGMQCDMDPVSQTQASESIMASGCSVVGWYHSHPMFAANPSIRDIETQQDFQTWFAKGGSAFVGIIISPYNKQMSSLCSDVRCLTVQQTDGEDPQSAGVPYQFAYRMTHEHWSSECILETTRGLADKYCGYHNRVQLTHHFKSTDNVTCLHKMLLSIEQYFLHGSNDESNTNLRSRIETIFLTKYTTDSSICDTG